MARKSANVTARVQPEIKQQAEEILDKIGLPVSVLIDTLYRQIIMTGSVPYSLALPKLPTRDGLADGQFDAMMAKGCPLMKLLPKSERVFENAVRSETDRTGN